MFIQRPGLGQQGESRAHEGPREGHACAEEEGQQQSDETALAVEGLGVDDGVDDHRRHAGACQQRGHGAHGECNGKAPVLVAPDAEFRLVLREIDMYQVEHGQTQKTKSRAMAALNQGEALMLPKAVDTPKTTSSPRPP